ncbi:MAG TPA: M48 family metallopeptidase [Candidatus Sulfotelmatobacter sp.]|jgi:predicted metal-dependent hydrolase|nr:M48 family metallopeptidase [Candidatus Sulfotelmatobacter sp.]
MFERLFKFSQARETHQLQVGSRMVPLFFVHHPRARRYLLRLQADGTARVTIPRRGSLATAREFVGKHIAWLEGQFQRLESQPKISTAWKLGTEIYLRGQPVKIEFENIGQIRLGPDVLKIPDLSVDLRPALEKYLHKLAAKELPVRVMELAALHSIEVVRVSVRNQRSRWGSCSRSGTISLNWRLIHTPEFVRDYIILHELAHRRHMNHSDRFWQEVQRLCPDYPAAERWLKVNRSLLR